MIEYINTRCSQWATWRRRKDDNGQGFPKECIYTRLSGRGGKGYNPTIDEAAWEIDQAVRALPVELKKAVMVFYLGRGTSEQKARDCGCHRDTLFVRVHLAHQGIMEWLNDEAAGVAHPPIKQKTCAPPTVSV